MPAFDEARRIILENVAPLGREEVPLARADGRVLAEEVRASRDLPPWDNSAMDGYAVRSADCAAPTTLVLSGYRTAGGEGPRVEPGCAVKIMTGTPVPEGSDAVVPVEETEEEGGRVRIRKAVRPGAHVRLRGEDLRAGERVVAAGTLLRPPEISLLASFGAAAVPVFRRARVAILSTGDELVGIGEPLDPGKIVDSNSHSLAAAVREAGGEPLLLGIARDTRESLAGKIGKGLAEADALVTSAGVSVGDKDLVLEVLEAQGVRRLFWKIDVKPGRPTAFGLKDGKPVFSLPGNPVSGMVIFEEFVRPALRKMMGHARPVKPLLRADLAEPVSKKAGRVELLRVRLAVVDGRLVARTAGDQSTGIVRTLVRADGIAVLPADRTGFAAGEPVDVHPLYSGDAFPCGTEEGRLE